MRIENSFPSVYLQNPASTTLTQPVNFYSGQQPQGRSDQGIIVDISPDGWARSKAQPASESQRSNPAHSPTECQTCNSRRYQDVSDDPSVSFQSPTHISPGQSAAMVAAHENEHVVNERAKAEQEGREIISQTVSLETSICPECKRAYVSGGETRTVSRQKNQEEESMHEKV